MRKAVANKKKRSKKIVGCLVINLETYEMILQIERKAQITKEANAKETTRKKDESTKKKIVTEIKKVVTVANRANNKTAKATEEAAAAEKKNNKKGKKASHLQDIKD